jgi:hypothetical protein
MKETLVIEHRGQSIRAQIVDQTGGHFDELYDSRAEGVSRLKPAGLTVVPVSVPQNFLL